MTEKTEVVIHNQSGLDLEGWNETVDRGCNIGKSSSCIVPQQLIPQYGLIIVGEHHAQVAVELEEGLLDQRQLQFGLHMVSLAFEIAVLLVFT